MVTKKEGYKDYVYDIYKNNVKKGLLTAKARLYKFLENEYKINYRDILSKRYEPDSCIFLFNCNNIYIIEMKSQSVGGSVDEKLQTCDFKLKIYKKLFASLDYDVHYYFLLGGTFRERENKDLNDTFKYIKSIKGCDYFFDYIPLSKLNLI